MKPAARKQPPRKRSRKQVLNIDVHLISEATGGLARHVASAVFSQFPQLQTEMHNHPFCHSLEKLREAKATIGDAEPRMVFSALAQPRLKRSLTQWCERRSIPHTDLLGQIVNEVASATGHRPVRDASRVHRCDNDYFRRMDAWEFTLQHDDSRRLETIGDADIILLGISRVGKTPVSAYLGSIGYRVANVSLASGLPVPAEVKTNRDKTIGLTIDPDRLTQIRQRRFELNRFKQALRARGQRPRYYSRQAVQDEVEYAEQQFRKLSLPTLNMTELTVEESAVRILQKLSLE